MKIVNSFYFTTFFLLSIITVNANNIQLPQAVSSIDFIIIEESGSVHIEGELTATIAKGNEIGASLEFFEDQKTALHMTNPTNELTVEGISHDRFGSAHVKFRQMYKGIRVITGQLITHFDKDNKIKTVNGTLVKNIDVNQIPNISSSVAVSNSLQDIKSFFGAGTANDAQLVIFPWENQFHLSWRIFVVTDFPMGRWEYFVDAHSGEIIFKANRIMNSAAIGEGLGVMGNVYQHIDTDFNGSTFSLIDYTRQTGNDLHGHNGQMGGGSVIRTFITSTSLPGSIGTDTDNFWTSTSQAAAVDGQVYTGLVYDWLLSELGRNGFNNSGSTMSTTVEYIAEGTNNAYWNGAQIVIWGASAGSNSLAGCPDVVAHEWGHAVTQYTSNMIYQKESGALNESFSDMMGVAFEFAHPQYDTPDWNMGENISASSSGFRSISNPHSRNDPDTYGPTDQYWRDVISCVPSNGNDWCGVHTNSGVGNKWFYLLSAGGIHNGVTVDGIGVENAIKVAYQANAFYWTNNTTYQEAAYGTISAANDLDPTFMWTIQVSKAWDAVGIYAPNPEISFDADTLWGWVPFDVNFEGNSVLNVLSWDWDFGDGEISSLQSPTHSFTNPGLFDVSLQINADGEIKTLNQQNYIIALADSISAESIETDPGTSVVVSVRIRNNIPLNRIYIPVEYGGMFSVTPDSISTVGLRTDYFDIKQYIHFDPFNKRFAYRLENIPQNNTPDLPIGEGDILKIYFTVSPTANLGDSVIVSLDGYNSYSAEFEGISLTYNAVFNDGKILIPNCLLRGDVNNDTNIDVSDLVKLVDYSFNSGSAPSPIELADVNCSGNSDVSDIVYLVAFMFSSGPPPCGC